MEVGAIASGAMAMQALQFQQSYAIAVTQKAMDAQELAGQELTKMLPQQPQPVSSTGIWMYTPEPQGPGRRSR